MRPFTQWLIDHPVAGFLLLGAGISYLIGFPAMIAWSAWAPPQPRVVQTYGSRLLVVYGPGLAALVMALLAHGRPAALDLLRRLLPHRADLPWAAAILLVGLTSAGVAFTAAGVSPGQLLGALRTAGWLLVAHFILQIVVVSTGEELGWRGWLLPRLLEGRTRVRATLLTAAAWGLWHGPMLLSDPLATALFLSAVVGLSFLYTWIWSRAGARLFLVVLAHATVNTPLFFWEEAGGAFSHPGTTARAWYGLEVMYAVAGCCLVLATWPWWVLRAPDRRPAAPPPATGGAAS